MWPLYWQLARGAQLFRWHQTLEAPAGRSEIPSFLSGARRNRHPWFVKTSAAVSSENSQETDGSNMPNYANSKASPAFPNKLDLRDAAAEVLKVHWYRSQ